MSPSFFQWPEKAFGPEKSDITESGSLIGRIPGGKLLQDTTVYFCYILANQISHCNSFRLFIKRRMIFHFFRHFREQKKPPLYYYCGSWLTFLLTKGVSPFSFASPGSPGFAINKVSISQEEAGMQGKLSKFRRGERCAPRPTHFHVISTERKD